MFPGAINILSAFALMGRGWGKTKSPQAKPQRQINTRLWSAGKTNANKLIFSTYLCSCESRGVPSEEADPKPQVKGDPQLFSWDSFEAAVQHFQHLWKEILHPNIEPGELLRSCARAPFFLGGEDEPPLQGTSSPKAGQGPHTEGPIWGWGKSWV